MNNHRDRAWLKDKYVNEGMTQAEVAQLCGVSQPTVGKYVRKYNLDDLSTGEHHDPEWLRRQYVDKDKTATEIGDMVGRSKWTIKDKLGEHGIKKRG